MGLFDRSGGGPLDMLRDRISSWQAHPFQNIAGTLAGFAVPGGGLAANAMFNRYNDNQFNNSANQFRDLSQQQTNMDTNSAMNAPLSGPLGAYDRAHPFGEAQGGQVSGSGGGMNMGGYTGGYNTQNWNLGQMTSGNAPRQSSSFVNDILDSISTGPGQPGTQQGGLFDSGENGPEARRDGSWGGGMGGRSANYGISPMQANGQNVIFGMDPNQMVMANGRRNMY